MPQISPKVKAQIRDFLFYFIGGVSALFSFIGVVIRYGIYQASLNGGNKRYPFEQRNEYLIGLLFFVFLFVFFLAVAALPAILRKIRSRTVRHALLCSMSAGGMLVYGYFGICTTINAIQRVDDTLSHPGNWDLLAIVDIPFFFFLFAFAYYLWRWCMDWRIGNAMLSKDNADSPPSPSASFGFSSLLILLGLIVLLALLAFC